MKIGNVLNSKGLVLAACLTALEGMAVVPQLPPSGSEAIVTKPLQDAIDRVSSTGGGVVSVPPGTWVTGELHLKSGVTLELQRGATLLGSTNIHDYVGKEVRCALILAEGVRDVGLKGFGTLDGRGGSFSHDHLRPYLVRFSACTNVVCEDVSLRSGGAWTIFCLRCDGVVYRRLKIWSHVNYCNDGMDISSRNVLVEDCEIDSDDDGLALKTPAPDVVVENVEVRNCRIASSCNAIHLGTESWGTFRNVDIHDCRIVPPSACHRFDWGTCALGAKRRAMIGLAGITVMCMDGEVMENVKLRNLTMKGVTTPIFVRCDRRHPERPGIPAKMDGVLIENVKAEAASRVASSITGVADLRPRNIVIRNFEATLPGGGTLDDCAFPVPECEGGVGAPTNLKFDYQALPAHGFYVRHADGVRFENVRTRCLSRDERPAIAYEDASVTVTDEKGLADSAGGLGKVFELTAESRRKLSERTWSSYRRADAYYREAKGQPEPPLVVMLGVNEKNRALATSVIGQSRRRDISVLMPFGRTVETVLAALDSVTEKGSGRKVYLKGDREMAALALELLASAPERFAGASVVALAKDVGTKLANVRGKAVDLIVAARNPQQAQAGFAAFNALASEDDRVAAADVGAIVRTGKIPQSLAYDGPSDPDFPPPDRRLVFRRASGAVRLSVTADRDVSAFDPSFGWIVRQAAGKTDAAASAAKAKGKPYTHLNFLEDPEEFRFAIIPDRQGANLQGREFRHGFERAIRVVNVMRPNFVMSVGDLIPYGWFRESSVRQQHKEMDEILAKIVPPFFWVIGNHDIAPSYIHPNHPRVDVSKANEISTKVWDELRGPEYYTFVYKGCLFVALNTIDHVRIGSKHRNISPEQYTWFKAELARHRDVRWTFIFMHQPAVWRTKEWFAFETENLVSRKYTVFAGDWHTYLHVRRHGRDYYALGVAGGTSGNGYEGGDMKKREKLLGREYGDLEHIMWVTMTKDGPVIGNIELTGFVEHDYLDQRNTKCVSNSNIQGPLDYPVPDGTLEHLKELKAEHDRYWAAEKAKK